MDGRKISRFYRTLSPTCAAAQKDGPGPVMVSITLCLAVHILGSQNVYSRAEGLADLGRLFDNGSRTENNCSQDLAQSCQDTGQWTNASDYRDKESPH